jgi:hypothetical protein
MEINSDTVLDNLARMVQVIQNDRRLQTWFFQLAHKSAVERRNEIYSAVERMRAEGKDADLAASFHLLADARVFEAARLAVAKLPAPNNIPSRQTVSQ